MALRETITTIEQVQFSRNEIFQVQDDRQKALH